MAETGLIHIYCGDGKGKTTAAVGLALRCAGGSGRVLFYQFLKDGTSGEICLLSGIDGITVFNGYRCNKFSFKMTDEEKQAAKAAYTKDIDAIKSRLSDGFELLVLDEVLHAVNRGFLDISVLTELIKNKPTGLEIVMTGREPASELIELADYVTEMKKIKHPFDSGIKARKLIEW